MSVSGVSTSGSVGSAYTPPPVQQQQAKASPKAPAADIVSLSKQAQQLASDGDTQAKEISESGADKASETSRGKA